MIFLWRYPSSVLCFSKKQINIVLLLTCLFCQRRRKISSLTHHLRLFKNSVISHFCLKQIYQTEYCFKTRIIAKTESTEHNFSTSTTAELSSHNVDSFCPHSLFFFSVLLYAVASGNTDTKWHTKSGLQHHHWICFSIWGSLIVWKFWNFPCWLTPRYLIGRIRGWPE